MSETVPYQSNKLKIEVTYESSRVLLMWSGESKDREPIKFIAPMFDEIYDKDDTKPIVMDFTKLEYMNSSTVTPIVKQLERAKKANRKLTIKYQKGLKWQALSFSALRVFSNPGMVDVVGV